MCLIWGAYNILPFSIFSIFHYLYYLFCQIVQLEDEFTSLLQGSSADTQKAFSSEMENIKRQCLEESATEDDDNNLVPDDYHSDDEKNAEEKEKEEEDEECHVTKVSSFLLLAKSPWIVYDQITSEIDEVLE